MPSLQQADEQFAYARLAADIESLVRAGTLRPGERLPSVRRMSAQRGVSLPTVLQAYRLLEARRIVRARPQSGFYVLPPQRPNLIEPRGAETLADPGEVTTGDLIMRVLEMVADPALVPLGTAARAEAGAERGARPGVLRERRLPRLPADQRGIPLVRAHAGGAGPDQRDDPDGLTDTPSASVPNIAFGFPAL